jgi:hypothetical protein
MKTKNIYKLCFKAIHQVKIEVIKSASESMRHNTCVFAMIVVYLKDGLILKALFNNRNNISLQSIYHDISLGNLFFIKGKPMQSIYFIAQPGKKWVYTCA